MKFNKSSQLLLVSAASLLVASLLTACSQLTQTLTVDFVFVASSKAAGANNYGEIDVFEINSESGRMRQIPASPVSLRRALSRSPKPSPPTTQTCLSSTRTTTTSSSSSSATTASFTPTTPSIRPASSRWPSLPMPANLFVVDTYQPLPSCSTAAPCSGSIAVFPLTAGHQVRCPSPSARPPSTQASAPTTGR